MLNPRESGDGDSNFKRSLPFTEISYLTDNRTFANKVLITGSNILACLIIVVGIIMIAVPCQVTSALHQLSFYHDCPSELTEEYLRLLTLINNYL
ncbi:unnamed protein product [Heterobilharzia americana]|nr:unnamed protein product [Heterobilharzia americana]